ncbi:Ig-like domain-containing protein [Corynebacterium diphtheriae]|uniref:Ig-like domain-containing protein n=1 Tax=Corynebacterium diphtheriae TaxID=1717 RepID=UPI003345B1EC
MAKQKVTRGAAACVAGCLALIPQPLVLAQDVSQPPAVVREEHHDHRLHNAITGVALLKQQGQGFAPLSPDAKLRSDEELGIQINWHTDSAVKPGDYFVYQIPSTLVLGGLTHFDINNGLGTPVIARADIDANNKLTVAFNDYLAVHSATGRGAITITAPLNYVAKRDHGYTTISLGEFGTHKLEVKPAQPSEPKLLVDSAAKAGEKLVVDSPESPESTTPTSTPNAQPQGWPDEEPWNEFDDDSVLPLHDGSWEYSEDALIDDSYRPETPPEMIARSKQPATHPEKPKLLDPEAPAVLAREQEAVRDVPRNAGRVIERPRSIIEMLFPSRDKNRDKQNSEASQTSESSVAPTSTSAAASESVTQGASSTNIQPASGVGSATGTASVIPGVLKPTEDPKARELIAGADRHHHDTEDDLVAMDDRHEIRQMQGDALGGQPVAAILINLAALAIMIGGAFLLLRLR